MKWRSKATYQTLLERSIQREPRKVYKDLREENAIHDAGYGKSNEDRTESIVDGYCWGYRHCCRRCWTAGGGERETETRQRNGDQFMQFSMPYPQSRIRAFWGRWNLQTGSQQPRPHGCSAFVDVDNTTNSVTLELRELMRPRCIPHEACLRADTLSECAHSGAKQQLKKQNKKLCNCSRARRDRRHVARRLNINGCRFLHSSLVLGLNIEPTRHTWRCHTECSNIDDGRLNIVILLFQLFLSTCGAPLAKSTLSNL